MTTETKKPIYNLNGKDVSGGTTNYATDLRYGIPIPEYGKKVKLEDRTFKYIGSDGREWLRIENSFDKGLDETGDELKLPAWLNRNLNAITFIFSAMVVIAVLMVLLGIGL